MKQYQQNNQSYATLFNYCRFTSKSHNYSVSEQDLVELFNAQEGKCAISGCPLTITDEYLNSNAQLAKINADRGYTKDNVRWEHSTISSMKVKLSDEEFLDWCFKVFAHTNDNADKWHQRFMKVALTVASFSKDPSTKVGAVIVKPDKSIISTGYNGFPKGMDDSPSLYEDREAKLSRVVHAEMNALIYAKESVEGYTIYTTLAPCDRCCVQLIQAGIKHFVFPKLKDSESRWAASIARSKSYIEETGCKWTEI